MVQRILGLKLYSYSQHPPRPFMKKVLRLTFSLKAKLSYLHQEFPECFKAVPSVTQVLHSNATKQYTFGKVLRVSSTQLGVIPKKRLSSNTRIFLCILYKKATYQSQELLQYNDTRYWKMNICLMTAFLTWREKPVPWSIFSFNELYQFRAMRNCL